MVEFETNGVTVQVIPENIRIIDSYKIKSKKLMKTIIIDILEKAPIYKGKRSVKSLIREWRSYNIFYNRGWFVKHTRDCDLEVNEALYRRIVYFFLGRF